MALFPCGGGGNESSKDITSEITWADTNKHSLTKAYLKNGVVYIFYAGSSMAHTSGELVATLPTKYKPMTDTYFVADTNVAMANSTFTIRIAEANGQITATTNNLAQRRLCFSIAYPIS